VFYDLDVAHSLESSKVKCHGANQWCHGVSYRISIQPNIESFAILEIFVSTLFNEEMVKIINLRFGRRHY